MAEQQPYAHHAREALLFGNDANKEARGVQSAALAPAIVTD